MILNAVMKALAPYVVPHLFSKNDEPPDLVEIIGRINFKVEWPSMARDFGHSIAKSILNTSLLCYFEVLFLLF